jgi:uncharacterized protein YggE
MKPLSTLLCAGLLAAASFAHAQTPQPVTVQPFMKKIDVTGAAELEVVPDRIFFSISLREYFKERDKDRVDIEGLEKQLVAAVREAGVPKENFQIENIYGNRWQWNTRKKPVDFLESKRYVLELSDLTKIDPILSKVDAKGIEYVTISRYDHTKMEQYRRDLKIKALQAAKEKASYLLQSVGEQPGGVLEIQELGDNIYYPQPHMEARSNMMVKAEMAQDAGATAGGADSDIGFKKIKLRYEMRAAFAIK